MNWPEIAGVYILGIFTQSITNDSQSITLCRMDLLDLERKLENLIPIKAGISNAYYATTIRDIKEILRTINVHCAGLFIRCPELEKTIDLNLERIHSWESNPSNSENHISSVIVELGNLWGNYNDNHYYEPEKLQKIRNSLHAGFLKRAFFRIREILRSLKNS